MRRFLAALLGMLIGYPLFAVVGYFAIGLFSSNRPCSVEASMTAAFVFTAITAGAIIGLICRKHRRQKRNREAKETVKCSCAHH